jgi:hypothetical protein
MVSAILSFFFSYFLFLPESSLVLYTLPKYVMISPPENVIYSFSKVAEGETWVLLFREQRQL